MGKNIQKSEKNVESTELKLLAIASSIIFDGDNVYNIPLFVNIFAQFCLSANLQVDEDVMQAAGDCSVEGGSASNALVVDFVVRALISFQFFIVTCDIEFM